MTTIYLVRHGQSTWNRSGRIQGKQDPPLSVLGRRQAKALAYALRRVPLDAIYCSPQKRAQMTADAVARKHELTVGILDGLAEIDHGLWEGLTVPEIRQQFTTSYRMWLTRPSQTQMPGGEHTLSVQERVLQAWEDIVTREAGQHVLVVSHEISIKVIIADVLDLSLDRIGQFEVSNAGVSIVNETGGQLRLTQLNGRCHLAGSDDRYIGACHSPTQELNDAP